MVRSLIILAAVLVGCSCQKNSADFADLGLIKDSIFIDDQPREYLIYFPSNLKAEAPLVFVCHGYTGKASDMANYSQMNSVADKHGFVVCYPQGSMDKNENPFWQVGYEFNLDNPINDISFIHHLAGTLQKEYGLSKENAFFTGLSNGGDMANYLACQSTPVFKAVAPVVGCLMKSMIDSFPKPNRIPLLMINGTADNITLWEGDMANQGGWGPYHSTPEMHNFWIKNNGCTTVVKSVLPNTNKEDGSFVRVEKHSGETAMPVWIYTVVNGGHDWPGGSGNMDLNASEAIWAFFSQFLTI